MKIAICEDNSTESVSLRAYIEKYCDARCYNHEISDFSSGEALLEKFTPGVFNLIFMDIYLPGISGVDIARKIRETDQDCLIIFITASQNHTMDGFMVQASGYVVKPFAHEQLDATLYMCRSMFEQSSRTIIVPYRRESLPIALTKILYVEVYGRDTLFHLQNGNTIETHVTLDEVEKKLNGVPFLRCHRSYIVNMNQVADIRVDVLEMQNGDLIPMRKNGRREVRMALASFIAGTQREVHKWLSR